jgi:hypothetical protein
MYTKSSEKHTDTEGLQADVVHVTFINFTIERQKWTIVDAGTGQTVFEDFLDDRDHPPGNKVTVPLVSDGTMGNARYKHENGSFTNASLLTEGQEVLMN